MPRSAINTCQLFERFPDEEAGRLYFESRIWPNGAECPVCQSRRWVISLPPRGKVRKMKPGRYRCRACVFDFSVRTGTIVERSKLPLHKWLHVMHLMPAGLSIARLSREIGIAENCASSVLGRICEACDGIHGMEGDDIVGGVLSFRHAPRYKPRAQWPSRIGKKPQAAA
jgi:transposase-like protein